MTYYSMSLIELLLKPVVMENYLPISQGMALAGITPVVFLGAVFLTLRIRKKLHR
jgi:uncharacterized membrane-anchored protein